MQKASEILRNCGPEIIENWESKVKEEIPAAYNSSNLALRNQLPKLLEDFADIIERYTDKQELQHEEKFEEIIKNSLEHGRHRATSSHYTVTQILKEYIIFHRVLTETLVNNSLYTTEVGIILKYTLETSMLNSAGSFTESLQDMREKLIGTLAHDIRNPITAAYFALDIISPTDNAERIMKLKKMGLGSLRKSLEMLEGLLDAITVKAGEGISLNFSEIDILKELKWVYKEASEIYSNEIILETGKDKIIGIFDGTAIRRVIENLVTNAVKYGSRNSPVRILVESNNDEVIIKIHNEGKPIPVEDQDEIFEFLSRGAVKSDSTLESWGMGLTLVKSVARAHGGNVQLESNEVNGTTFSLLLKKYANKPGKVRTELNYSEN
ncbi:sensor histidine kinase [Christiangramia sabulilitoris]|uniref:histidine kinase n=1 Tax=Christiangramia sabulilitoris TaxID=2583991 RepID=A0A550I2J3_9FLAO|nr:HAMP domain-containing sensor histidine kinase [Christiangramia sabulilitoris]TRO65196.1 HAMP domain-containing histidine kinase [Christiangramia sabulilitoris]